MGGAAVAHLSLTDVDAQTDSDREQGETVQYRHALRTSRALFHPLLVLSHINLLNCGHLFKGSTF